MKRYIRSDFNTDRLHLNVDGEDVYLPTWYAEKSDDEVNDAKQILEKAVRDRHNRVNDYSADDYEEIEIDERSLRRDLKAEGFSKADCDEIIAMIYNGHTVDSAIQRQIMKNNGEW